MKGIITKIQSNLYIVKTDAGIIECTAKGLFKFKKLSPLVGDYVEVNNSTIIPELMHL